MVVEKLIFSNGPTLTRFLKDPADFKGTPLTAPVSEVVFAGKRSALVQRLLECLDARYKDLSDSVVAATQISCFEQWPVFSQNRDQIKG